MSASHSEVMEVGDTDGISEVDRGVLCVGRIGIDVCGGVGPCAYDGRRVIAYHSPVQDAGIR